MKLKIKDTVFVFDLDDTLYNEIDFHSSGIKSVVSCFQDCVDEDLDIIISKLISNNEKDLWGAFCKYLNLPICVKDSMLWHYRLHTPNITLKNEVSDFLDFLLSCSAGVAILTDGRFITQKNKLRALKIEHIPVYISEEFGGMKPNPKRFKLIENSYPGCCFVYIGDNPKKDFITPNNLGWFTFGVLDKGYNIHSQSICTLDDEYLPKVWMSNLIDLKEYLI